MAYFSDADEVYGTLGRLAQDAIASQGLGPAMHQIDAVVQMKLSDPPATITLSLLETESPKILFGTTSLRPNILMEMSADTAHEVFLGGTTVSRASGAGRLRLEIDEMSIWPAWPATEVALPVRYAQILVAVGREDLVETTGWAQDDQSDPRAARAPWVYPSEGPARPGENP